MRITAGIDVGATYTKAVLADEAGSIVSRHVSRTGYDLPRAAERVLADALAAARLQRHQLAYVAATGYGRYAVPFRDLAMTELTAHAYALHQALPEVRTLLDIGGQTAKAMRLDERGRVRAFRLNDKCAAGSGAFLEKTVRYMGFDTADIARLADASGDPATVSSICTVFAESEVINHLAAGRTAEDVCAGALVALAGRAGQLIKRVKPDGECGLTGGLTKVPRMRLELEALLGRTVHVPRDDLGVYGGALGAVLLAHRRLQKLSAQACGA